MKEEKMSWPNDLVEQQMAGCTQLAHRLTTRGIESYVIYTPGDAPYIRIPADKNTQVCYDGTGAFDIWNADEYTRERIGLSIDEVVTIFTTRREQQQRILS